MPEYEGAADIHSKCLFSMFPMIGSQGMPLSAARHPGDHPTDLGGVHLQQLL